MLDTNVWISAALSRNGAPAQVVERVLRKGHVVMSPGTWRELESRLWLSRFDRWLSPGIRRKILNDLKAVVLWFHIPPGLAGRSFCRDADDDVFIQTALTAFAKYLVTGDRDLLAATPPAGLTILTPASALEHPAWPDKD